MIFSNTHYQTQMHGYGRLNTRSM